MRELRHAFFVWVLVPTVRGQIEPGDFAGLRTRDAALYQSRREIGPERLAPLRHYLATTVKPGDFSEVA